MLKMLNCRLPKPNKLNCYRLLSSSKARTMRRSVPTRAKFLHLMPNKRLSFRQVRELLVREVRTQVIHVIMEVGAVVIQQAGVILSKILLIQSVAFRTVNAHPMPTGTLPKL